MVWSATRWAVSGAAAIVIVAGAPGCKRENPSWLITSGGEGGSDTQSVEISGGALTSSGASTGASAAPSGSGTQGLGTSGALSTGTESTAGELTAGADASTTGASGEPGDSASTGAPLEPETEHVINYNEGAACDLPFWCHQAGNLNNGILVNTEAGECFEPQLPPPYELTSVRYKLWGAIGPLANSLALRVLSAEGDEPPQLVASVSLDEPGLASVGDHELELAEPILIEGDRFCVVLDGGQNGASAMGVAIDKTSEVLDSSYIRLPSPVEGCFFPDYTDLFDIDAVNHGNWCVDATIRELPP